MGHKKVPILFTCNGISTVGCVSVFIGRAERAHLVVLSARFFGILHRPYVVVSMRMRYMCAFLFRRVSVTVSISSLRIPSSSSSAKGNRERASCPRICASSSVARPREREATETAEEREAS